MLLKRYVLDKSHQDTNLTHIIALNSQIRRHLVLQADKVAKKSCARVMADVLGISTSG